MVKVKNLKAVLKGKGKSKGFSLAEITVGLAVLGLATVALVGWQVNEYRHAKAKEIASTLQAIDAGLYQVSSLVGYIPKPQNVDWTQTTSANSDTSYGCILRNTDSWSSLIMSSEYLISKHGGKRLGINKIWFPSWNHAFRFYMESVDPHSIIHLLSFWTPTMRSVMKAPIFLVVDRDRGFYTNMCVCSEWTEVCDENSVCDSVCTGTMSCDVPHLVFPVYNASGGKLSTWLYYTNIPSYTRLRPEALCGVLYSGIINVTTQNKITEYPSFIYVKCNNNPPPNIQEQNNFKQILSQNLLDPRIDLKKLAEQGYVVQFKGYSTDNNSGRLVELRVFNVSQEEGDALRAMLGGNYNPDTRTYTYYLNKGNGYSVQSRSELGYNGSECWRQ